LFSDILVVPDALGQTVSFESGHGPRLEPLEGAADLGRLSQTIDLDRLEPVFETIDRVKGMLPADTPLIGFCGAPWTVASYMVAGRGTPDQAPARRFAYSDPAAFQRLIDTLVEASIAYLDRQLAAGVEAVQIFDSWAGVLPRAEFQRWCEAPMAAIVAGLRRRRPDARIIGFPRVSGNALIRAATTGITALGLDTPVDPVWADAVLPRSMPLQGNLDPIALLAGGTALDAAIDSILAAFAERPHVFNLGHGILPETPIAHVDQMIRRLRGPA
jgi:uroporphyrinogen decarboxylase